MTLNDIKNKVKYTYWYSDNDRRYLRMNFETRVKECWDGKAWVVNDLSNSFRVLGMTDIELAS